MNLAWETLASFGMLGALVLALPFLPALRTLKRKPVQAPVQDVGLSAQDQCETFKHLVTRQFGHLLSAARAQGALHGETDNGRPYIVLGINSNLADELPSSLVRLRSLVVAAGHLDVPSELICERDIYAEGKINIGYSSVIKSALSPRDIAINTRARVARWVHSDRRIDVAESAWVKGWANAGLEITLARRARFEHLSAPRIAFGRQTDVKYPDTEVVGRYAPPQSSDGDAMCVQNLGVPDSHVSKGDLIATDTLSIGSACRVIGDLRAGRHLVIGAFSRVEGAICSDGTITIQEGCRLAGPIIAREGIFMHTGCLIGSPERPTTLTAPRMKIAEGCVAHGTVLATQRGEVFFQE